MDAVFMTEQERKKVESFKIEDRRKWEREQYLLKVDADRKGETFTPGVYEEVGDDYALTAVRAGWKSALDRLFERKYKREAVKNRQL